MKSLKHIGRMDGTNSKVLVAFRTLPGESDHCLVLPVSSLPPQNHDTIMTLVETPQAQDAFEFGEIMFIRTFSDGRTMLQSANADGILVRVPTDKVIMTPNTTNEIKLSELNTLIAEQKNCAVDDLYTFVSGAAKVEDAAVINDLGRDAGEPDIPEYTDPDVSNDAAKTTAGEYTEQQMPIVEDATPTGEQVLDDKQLAASFRSQADAMFKEAQQLRKQAEELDPKPAKTTSKRTATKAKTTKAKTTKAKTTKAKDGVSD